MSAIRNRPPLVLTIPLHKNLPRELSPNFRSRSHWPRTRAIATARQEGKVETLALIDPNDPYQCFQTSQWPLTLHVVVARHGRNVQEWDDDNIPPAVKPYRDGIAEALGIDDANFRMGTLTQVVSETGGAYLRIAIEPAAEEARAA